MEEVGVVAEEDELALCVRFLRMDGVSVRREEADRADDVSAAKGERGGDANAPPRGALTAISESGPSTSSPSECEPEEEEGPLPSFSSPPFFAFARDRLRRLGAAESPFTPLSALLSPSIFTPPPPFFPSSTPSLPFLPPPPTVPFLRSSRCRVEFHLFLMALSVLPGSRPAMAAHLLPSSACASTMTRSSSSVQASLRMSGLRWLNQRSRHCLPRRPVRCDAMKLHFLTPYLATSWHTSSSSAFIHGPLMRPGLSTFCQRCRHCTSDLDVPNADSAMRFQFLPS